ncbi:hypothetical protein EDB85DRAFT_2001645 [Lactarius pseudohatsudake]|nr:hypothetical protein EDB85DRAFT_2001645 [Lactarius pseudohatsudake]
MYVPSYGHPSYPVKRERKKCEGWKCENEGTNWLMNRHRISSMGIDQILMDPSNLALPFYVEGDGHGLRKTTNERNEVAHLTVVADNIEALELETATQVPVDASVSAKHAHHHPNNTHEPTFQIHSILCRSHDRRLTACTLRSNIVYLNRTSSRYAFTVSHLYRAPACAWKTSPRYVRRLMHAGPVRTCRLKL